MSLEIKHIYEFGSFRLDLSEKLLSREGAPVPVTPKVFETLQVLIEKAGHLVSKDELMQKVWQDRFVEETNLTFNIKMLRKALRDDASKPQFIETVPRRGYRFIADITEIYAENKNVNDSLGADVYESDYVSGRSSKPRFFERHFSSTIILVVLAVGLLGLGTWILTVRSISGSVVPVLSAGSRSEPLSFSGSVFYPRLSPDGKYLAYVTKDHDTQTIWLQELSTGTNVALVPFSADDYLGLMFSSKSDFVYFVRKAKAASQAEAGIYRISIFGGIPSKLVTNIQGWFSISPVDDQIAFVRHNEEGRSELDLSDADGKGERILAVREKPYNFRASRWSRDGDAIAVAVGQSDSGANDFGIVEIDTRSGKEREVTTHKFVYISDLEWLPDGSGLLVTARQNDTVYNEIWQVSRNTGEVRKVIDDGTSFTTVSLDKDAEQMAVSLSVPDFSLNIYDLENPANSFRTGASVSPTSFTRDGQIIFAATKGQLDVWMMNADGSSQRQLTNHPMDDFCPLASADGKFIFFTSTRSGDRQIWRMKTDGSDCVQITKREGGYPIFVSPDGGEVFYLSATDMKIWKVPTSGGDETLFFEKRVFYPAFSPDGKYLAYFDKDIKNADSYILELVANDNSSDPSFFKLPDESTIPGQIAWASDSRSFFYPSSVRSKTTFWRQQLTGGLPEKVSAPSSDEEIVHLAVSPSGNKLAYISGIFRHEAKLIKNK